MNRLAIRIAVVFALIGFGALWLAGRHADYAGKVATEGVTADAEITAKFTRREATKNRMVGDSAPATTGVDVPYVRYRFYLADGRPFEKEESVGPEFYDQAETGSVWRVAYWPGDPETASLFESRFAQSAEALSWVAGVALALSCLLFGYRFRRRIAGAIRPTS